MFHETTKIFQNSWVWDYHLGVHLLWAIILAVKAHQVYGVLDFNSREHHQTHNIEAHRQMRNNGAHRQIHNNGVYSLVFNSGEHHQMRKNGAHRQLDSSGAHRQLHNNGAHHQLHHSGAHHRMLNNGAHHRMLSNGTHRRILSNGAHHRMLINGEHHRMLNSGVHNQMFNSGIHQRVLNSGGVKDLIMEMTNQPERIQLMFNMDFRWTIIMKFQIAQQKELRLIPNNHNHPVLVSQVVLILDKIHDNPEQEVCSTYGETHKIIKVMTKMKISLL